MSHLRSILAGSWFVLPAAAAGAAAGWASTELHLPSEAARCAAIAGSVALTLSLTGAVAAAARRRSLERLRGALGVADADSVLASSSPIWIRPFVDGVIERLRDASKRHDDLTARLRQTEIRFNIADAERRHGETILHSLRDAVLVTDAFNEISLANAAAARLLGFDADKAVHKPIDQVLADESLRQMIREVRQSGLLSKHKHLEHSMRPAGTPAGGAPASFDVTIACLPDTNPKEVGGVVTILRDITREKEIAQMKSDFVSQASHELRTPIASINAYVEMLVDAEAQDEKTRQEFYGIIKTEAERLSRMIDNMLNISRIEAGIGSLERCEVDFAKVIREVVETLQPQARTKNILLVEKIGPLIYTAEADRDMMTQVIVNLVSNAIKYTPEGGRVTLSVENDDASRSVLVVVQDTGLGIPPEAMDKIFGKFFRIESYKRMAKGTGLGLNLVKHIVETAHHGQVGVSSQVGMGSRFWFTIPYEFKGASSASDLRAAPPHPAPRSAHDASRTKEAA